VTTARTKLKKYWSNNYRPELGQVEKSPEPEPKKVSYLKSVLNKGASTADQIPKPLGRRDELYLYLNELSNVRQRLIDYWKDHEIIWPNLTKMAFDF
jgi:hypothetical protein